MSYYTMEHRGGLKEALETKKPLDEYIASKLLKAKIYKFYAFDERIGCNRYILHDFHKCLGMPTWLLEEVEK